MGFSELSWYVRTSDGRRYCGSLLWDLGLTSLIFRRGNPRLSSRREAPTNRLCCSVVWASLRTGPEISHLYLVRLLEWPFTHLGQELRVTLNRPRQPISLSYAINYSQQLSAVTCPRTFNFDPLLHLGILWRKVSSVLLRWLGRGVKIFTIQWNWPDPLINPKQYKQQLVS